MYSRCTPVREFYVAPAEANVDDVHVIDIDIDVLRQTCNRPTKRVGEDGGKLANVTSWLFAGKTTREMDEDRFLAQTGVVGVIVKDACQATTDERSATRSDAACSAGVTPEASPRFEELLEAEEAPAYLCLSDPLACSMGAVSSPRLSSYAEDPLACSIGAVSSPRLSNCADLDFLDRPNRSSADVGRRQSVRLQMDARRSLNEPVSLSLVSLALDEIHDGLV